MKKRLFSFRLYADGMKQLRTIGVLCILALNLIGVLTPLLTWLDRLDTNYSAQTVNFIQMNPLIVSLFCAVAPLLTLVLFSFLNKRESSDLYHAVPETRTCLFFSFFAAIATWLLVITATTMVLTTAAYSIFPQLYSVNYISVLSTGFNTLSGSLLIAAAVAVAMGVTGTAFTNVLVALLLIFLPRLLIHMITTAVSFSFPLVDGLSVSPLLDFEYNVPVSTVFHVFLGGRMSSLTALSSGIYTLVLAVLYMLLAACLFKRRASETAGQSAPNRYLQGLYRLLVGLVLSSVATIGLFNTVTGAAAFDSSTLGSLGVLYLVSVLLMPVFDILSTRRVKGLLRRNVVSVLLLVLVNVGVFGVTYGAYRAVACYTPKAEEITSVRLLRDDESFLRNDVPDYFESKVAQIELTSPEVRKLVATRLQYSKDLLTISRARYNEAYRDMISVPVAIKKGAFTRQRRILITEDERNIFSKALSEIDGFKEVYAELPASLSLQTIEFDGVQPFAITDTEPLAHLYQTLRDEAKSIGFEKWYALLQGDSDFTEMMGKYETYDVSRISTFYGQLYEGNNWYSVTVPLVPSVLPKTCAEYIQLYTAERRKQTDYREPAELLNNLSGGDVKNMYVECFNFNSEYGNTSVSLNDSEILLEAEPIRQWASALPKNTAVDVTKPFFYVNVLVFEEEREGDEVWGTSTEYDSYYPATALPEWMTEYLQEQQ